MVLTSDEDSDSNPPAARPVVAAAPAPAPTPKPVAAPVVALEPVASDGSAAIDDLFSKRMAALHAKREAAQLEDRAAHNARVGAYSKTYDDDDFLDDGF